ncbi:MAG: RelA/SpoT domain-containing protein [Clostridium sp.]|nr:RelA/SpoT domain-containing protein [Clostridium sp.]
MAFEDTKRFDLERIQRELNISSKTIENLPIEKMELEKMYNHFQTNMSGLEQIKSEILSRLNSELSDKVHSIRCRVKDPDHLIEKIIRNMNANPQKYADISIDNYFKIITDLIGVRVIILDKRDWREVHNSLLQIFCNIPERYIRTPKDTVRNYDKYAQTANEKGNEFRNSYHAEKPVVYITSKDDENLYKDENLEVNYSKSHYRSVHYIIRYKDAYFEIQVRTLFEEGWLEFDHRIKYPYDQNNKKKQEFAGVLSSLAVAADRLISFYDESDFKSDSDNGEENQEVHRIDTAIERKEKQTLEEKMKELF